MAKSSVHIYRVTQALITHYILMFLMCWLMECELTTYLCAQAWHYYNNIIYSSHSFEHACSTHSKVVLCKVSGNEPGHQNVCGGHDNE